jgi:hypothetical protein
MVNLARHCSLITNYYSLGLTKLIFYIIIRHILTL